MVGDVKQMSEKVVKKKYYCEKCKSNHLFDSEVGRKHRGIKVEKPKRKKFSINLPDGTIYETTSIYEHKYAVLSLRDLGEMIPDSYSKKWRVELYVDKKKAEKRAKWFKEPHQIGVKEVRLIVL